VNPAAAVAPPLARLQNLRKLPGLIATYEANLGANNVRVLFATRNAPSAWKSHVAYYRLAQALRISSVPNVTAHSISLTHVLEATKANPTLRFELAHSLAVRADGTIAAAVTSLPSSVDRSTPSASLVDLRLHCTRQSEHAAKEHDVARPSRVTQAGWLVHDYLAARGARGAVRQDRQENFWRFDNDGAFLDSMSAHEFQCFFDALKNVEEFPVGLDALLANVTRSVAEQLFQQGPYEQWLLSRRKVSELLIRVRAVQSLLKARGVDRELAPPRFSQSK